MMMLHSQHAHTCDAAFNRFAIVASQWFVLMSLRAERGTTIP
jgi:hypothetical protein